MPKFLGRVEPARHEGDDAPKSADLWLRIRCRMRQAPLGAPIADVYRHRAPLFVAGRSWAISWLPGPRSGSGEPRHRPGARPCVSRPQAPHLVPLHERLMIAPFKWTRWLQCKRVLEGGDKIGLAQNHCREEREAKLADTISRERRSANMELSVRQALHEHVGRGGLT